MLITGRCDTVTMATGPLGYDNDAGVFIRIFFFSSAACFRNLGVPAAAQRVQEEAEVDSRHADDPGPCDRIHRPQSCLRLAQLRPDAHTQFVFITQLGRAGRRHHVRRTGIAPQFSQIKLI